MGAGYLKQFTTEEKSSAGGLGSLPHNILCDWRHEHLGPVSRSAHPGAAAWAIELQRLPATDHAQIFEERIDFDQPAVSSWLAGTEPGRQLDAAVGVPVEGVRNTDPEAAFQWAMSISEDNTSLSRMGQAFAHLRATDREAARATPESSGMDKAERDAV